MNHDLLAMPSGLHGRLALLLSPLHSASGPLPPVASSAGDIRVSGFAISYVPDATIAGSLSTK